MLSPPPLLLLLALSASAQKCASRAGVVLGVGANLGQSKQPDAASCCAKCNASKYVGGSTCITWTFHAKDKSCWLHSAAGPQRSDSSAVSGMRDGPLPPKPIWNACTEAGADKKPYCDTTLSIDARVKDLTSRVATSDAGAQLTARQSPALQTKDGVDLPAYYWGTNAIHGMQNVGCLKDGSCPTSFPAPCALSAAWNTSLVHDMGGVIGRELRAYYNAEVHDSLDTWSPTINLNRDPRWGRNVESPGEDPLLCGMYGAAYTKGLQEGADPKVRQATVTLKHWVAYSIESYKGVTRHNVDVNVSAYDLANSYFPAWERTVKEGGAKGIMCSYNMLNGKPTCGNPALAATLREDWGFTGYITSDSDSCADIYSPHNFAKSKEAAAAICLAGGTDIDSGGTYSGHLSAAVSEGLANRSLVDAALSNSYRMRFEMGLFDPHVPNAYRNITTAEVGSAANQAMSLRGARSAMVLLKNAGAEDGKADGREAAPTLPFATGIKVAVIGRVADDANSLTGNYDGPLCPQGGASCWPSICAAVSEQVGRGGNATCTAGKASTKDAAVAAARAADAVVFVADNAADGGGEGHDRETIGLSSDQREVAEALFALKKPAVLVLVNGGMISIDGLKDSAPAILETFMPGVHGAQAIAETIFGANVPGGKLPVTMYPSDYVDKVDFLSMDMSAGPGRSYRYYTGTPTYPFGFGLSYTTFSMAWSPQPPSGFLETSEAAPAKYSVVVKNTGTKFAGDEVVQLYIKPDAASRPAGTPVEQKRLVAFERVHLSPGEAKTVTFEVAPEDFALVDADGHKAFRYGHFDVIASRGHGDELVARIATSRPGAAPARLSTLRKWW